jgi:AcrR family transcriptional regulator
MSQGNLCYHFPKKEAIITALYHQLVNKFDKLMQEINPTEISIKLFWDLLKITNQYFEDYKFLMLNFVQIMRWHPDIHAHYQALTQTRIQQTLFLFQAFEQVGLLKKEAYEGQYLQMIEQYMILNNFWLSHAEILYLGDKQQKLHYFNQLIAAFIFPYLTEKGKVDFQKLN